MNRSLVTCRCGLKEISTPERVAEIARVHRQVTGHTPSVRPYELRSMAWLR